MFSGIVEEMGVVRSLTRGAAGARLSLLARTVLDDLRPGDSVSVSGACVTVVDVDAEGFAVDLSEETLTVTTLGGLKAGGAVNLERALKVNDRLGGHLVTGHVDGTGRVVRRAREGDIILLTVDTPDAVWPCCVRKGSLAVDGVSLTINAASDARVCVTIIPHTAAVTTLGAVQAGEAVNLESDLIGKYVERLLHRQRGGHGGGVPDSTAPVIDREYLRKHGLL